MNGKVIIFVVLALGAQHSSANSIQLSESAVSTMTSIRFLEDSTILGTIDALSPAFDVLEQKLANLIYDLDASALPSDCSEIIATARYRAGDTVEYTLEAIELVLGEECSAFEETRNETSEQLNILYTLVPEAIAWAQCSNYSEAIEEIENRRVVLWNVLSAYVQSLYRPLSAGLTDTCSDEVENVIESACELSTMSVINGINAVFNAIRVYAQAYNDAGYLKNVLIPTIRSFRDRAIVGFSDDVHLRYSVIKAVYLSLQRDHTGTIAAVVRVKYAQMILYTGYVQGTEPIFERILVNLWRVGLGLRYDGESDFSLDDLAHAITVAKWKAGTNEILQSILSIYSDACYAVESARTILFLIIDQAAEVFYDELDIARSECTNSSEILAQLESLNEQAVSQVGGYVEIIFDLLRNGQNWGDDVEEQLTKLENEAIAQIQSYTNIVCQANAILATATAEDAANSASAIQTLEGDAIAAMEIVSTNIGLAAGKILAASVIN